MKTGIYQHGAVTEPEVAEAISALGVPVAYRNALYFNERETEKFGRVVVDEGQNTDRIRTAYALADVEVVPLAAFLKEKAAKPAPAPAPAAPAAPAPVTAPAALKPAAKAPKAAAFNPDAPRSGKKPGKNQGVAAAAPAPEKKDA
jgi:hypothetical protein